MLCNTAPLCKGTRCASPLHPLGCSRELQEFAARKQDLDPVQNPCSCGFSTDSTPRQSRITIVMRQDAARYSPPDLAGIDILASQGCFTRKVILQLIVKAGILDDALGKERTLQSS